ncbi:MAG: hypothetical protein ACLFPQ_01225 [Candidatus Woesearchaeota archaeon]
MDDIPVQKSEIPGWVFLIVGLLVTVVSSIMNAVNEGNPMLIFIIAGIVMLGWGGAKYLLFGQEGKAGKDITQEIFQERGEKTGFNRQKNQNPDVKNCPRCRYALNKTDNFCYNCGTDVRNI